MPICVACKRDIDPHRDESVRLPQSKFKRTQFARIMNIDEDTMQRFHDKSRLCPQHFTADAFVRDNNNRIIGIHDNALPDQNAIHLVPVALPPTVSSTKLLSTFSWESTFFTPIRPSLHYKTVLAIPSRAPPLPPRRLPQTYPSILKPLSSTTSQQQSQNIPPLLPSHQSESIPPSLPPMQSENIPPSLPPMQSENIPPSLPLPPTNVEYDFDDNLYSPPTSSTSNDKEPQRQSLKRKYNFKTYDIFINADDENFGAKKIRLSEEQPETKTPAPNLKNKDASHIEMALIQKERLLSIFLCCPKCHTQLNSKQKKSILFVGTAATIYYNCSGCEKPHQTWSTQSYLGATRIYKGNALVACAASIAPVPFPTMKTFFQLAKISCFGNSVFQKIFSNNVRTVVKQHYSKEHQELTEMLQNLNEVNLLTDGQWDSPGFSAKLCRVTAIHSETGFVVAFKALDKEIFGGTNSSKLELEGTDRILKDMEDNNIKVKRLTTDRSITVRKMVSEKYGYIQHLLDAWHAIKSKVKDLRDKGKLKKSRELQEYLKSIKNHIWWAVKEGNGDGIKARELLLSVLFHIQGVHEWEAGNISQQLNTVIENTVGNDRKKRTAFIQRNPSKCSALFQDLEFTTITRCCHEPYVSSAARKKYLMPTSWAYWYLMSIITQEKFLADFVKLSPDFTTSRVENFNSLATGKYCPKKTFFNLEGYEVRSQLAILHHNNNIKCEKEGTRKVKGIVWQNSKANPGEKIKKVRKTKAPILWQHNIVNDCIEKISKGTAENQDVAEGSFVQAGQHLFLEEEYDSGDELNVEIENPNGEAYEGDSDSTTEESENDSDEEN